jgi:glycosyltransferase involved in cell wall biosynthesis
VLLCGRPNLLTKPGGDTRQILGLKRQVEALAAGRVTLSLELRPRLEGVDLVHVFNLSRPVEPALQAEHARRHGVPVVCSPIFQDLWEYNRRGRYGAGQALFWLLGQSDSRLETLRAALNLCRSGPAGLKGLPLLARCRGRQLQRRVLENSQVVLFNSPFEAQTVRTCLGELERPFVAQIIPVGVDPDELGAPDPGPFCGAFGLSPGFVLCVGRLEDLKNQLGLILALEREPVDLVLIGQTNPLHRAYARAVRRAAARRSRRGALTLLIEQVERPLLLSAMAAASVHVLPSWFETAGLTSLEAALAGCAVVSTSRGYAQAYLGREAHYCDPGDPESLRTAVARARSVGPSSALQRRVAERYTERRAAELTAAAYQQAVA